MLQIGSGSFNLQHTLTSGQSFRWHSEGRVFVGVVSGHALRLEQKGNRLLYCSAPRNFPLRKLRRYLGLDGPYAAAIGSFPKDALLDQTVERFRGMRLLQQDPWETLISFI
ncbi:8-oxoguanine DNA glycosylase, N-terminal domain-containing protein, partial [bacterium]|nr:8-oxoguanine DNA glycosylase, N-terminal domain-containing protein [bacterium]